MSQWFCLKEIRKSLENSLIKYGYKKNFKHPFSGIYYNIFVKDDLIHIEPKAKTKGESKILTWDCLLHLWLKNDNYTDDERGWSLFNHIK